MGSNDGTLQFNAVGVVATGNYTVTICYLNGDAVRYALLSVNGSPGTPVSFPSTGSFQTVGSIQITATLNTGCNTLLFYNPIVGSWAPDFDRITFNCPTCALPTPTLLRIAYAYTNTYAYSQTYAHSHSYTPDPDADSGRCYPNLHDSGRVRCASVSHYRRWKHRTRLARALCEYHRQL